MAPRTSPSCDTWRSTSYRRTQPRDRCAASSSAPAAIDRGFAHVGLALWIVEETAYVVVQRALVALQRQRMVAALLDDLAGDLALAVERVGGHDRAFQGKHLEQSRDGFDLVRLGVGGDLRQHHALLTAPRADHVQRRLAAGAIERAAQNLAIDGDNTFNLLAKARHEPLKRGAELRRIKLAEQPAERVMAGQPVRQLEEPAQERLLRLREHRHVRRALPAAQHRTQRDHQKLVEVMQRGVAGSRVLETLSAGSKLIQGGLPVGVSNANG